MLFDAFVRRFLYFNNPLTRAKDWHTRTVGFDSVNIQLIRADHEIGVDEGLVSAARREFLVGHVFAADDRVAVRISDGDVTGGILVEQCVVKQDLALADGRTVRHEGALTEPRRVLVCLDQFFQRLFAFFR